MTTPEEMMDVLIALGEAMKRSNMSVGQVMYYTNKALPNSLYFTDDLRMIEELNRFYT